MGRISFEDVAGTYDAGRAIEVEGLDAWRTALAMFLPTTDGLPILDLGSGTGLFAVALAEWFGVSVVGVEPSRAMLREAREKRSHPRVSYVEGDADHIPLEAQRCGAAWLSTVIHHVRSLEACAREVSRVLSASSRVLVRSSFPGRHDHITLFRFFPGASRIADTFPRVDSVVSAFARFGFAQESFQSVPQVSAPTLVAFRDRVASRADTTLRLLSDDEFARGLASIDAAIEACCEPAPVVDRLDLLVLRRGG